MVASILVSRISEKCSKTLLLSSEGRLFMRKIRNVDVIQVFRGTSASSNEPLINTEAKSSGSKKAHLQVACRQVFLVNRGSSDTAANSSIVTISFVDPCRPRLRVWEIQCETVKDATQLEDSLRAAIGIPLLSAPRSHWRFLVFVNPLSGRGKAWKTWKKIVEPVLAAADIQLDVCKTECAGHARTIAAQYPDLSSYHTILTVSGDGLLHEIVNGILRRNDWESVVKSVRLAILPCGSGNGLSAALGIFHSLSAGLCGILSDSSRHLDVASVVSGSGKRWAFLTLTHGLVAEVDVESDPCRCCGYARYTFFALWKILRNRQRRVTLQFPAEGDHETRRSTGSPGRDVVSGVDTDYATPEEGETDRVVEVSDVEPEEHYVTPRLHASSSETPDWSAYIEKLEPLFAAQSGCGPRLQYLDEGTVAFQDSISTETVKTPITLFVGSVSPMASTQDCFAPHGRMDDGYCDCMWMEKMSRTKMLAHMPELQDPEKGKSLVDGTPHVFYKKCQAFRIVPHDGQRSKTVLDGERTDPKEAVCLEVHHRVLRIACPAEMVDADAPHVQAK